MIRHHELAVLEMIKRDVLDRAAKTALDYGCDLSVNSLVGLMHVSGFQEDTGRRIVVAVYAEDDLPEVAEGETA